MGAYGFTFFDVERVAQLQQHKFIRFSELQLLESFHEAALLIVVKQVLYLLAKLFAVNLVVKGLAKDLVAMRKKLASVKVGNGLMLEVLVARQLNEDLGGNRKTDASIVVLNLN